jgi:uncharacterized membrane protein
MSVELIGAIIALILGIIAVVENIRNWAGWGVIVLAAVIIYGALPGK